jgi:hypothetical protein
MRCARVAILGLAIGCGSEGPPPPLPGGGPPFAINSPADGSSIAGVTWFSVQPEDIGDVARVDFNAGDKDLGADTTPADGFKVFLTARDHAAGTLRLEATVTGKDGKTATGSISVTNVPDPPSSATVSAAGAVLGTMESDGSLSTLTIAPGDAVGAAVTFSARTKEEIKTATGVDYDALGVTFLGAQEITTTKTLVKPLGLSSGGFGPRVQPGQVVVQYRIAPDADGDGKGELVVVNTASVAPNGDVISDPIPTAMVKEEATTIAGGHQKPSHSPSMGPPGTVLQFHVLGFNANSVNGNVATWTCSDGSTFSFPGTVFPERLNANPAAQLFQTIIPGCPPGPAMVTLTNLSTGGAGGPFTITVTTAPSIPNPATPVMTLAMQLARLLNGLPPAGLVADGAVSDGKDAADDTGGPASGAAPDEGAIAANLDLAGPPPQHPGGSEGIPCLTQEERDFLRKGKDAFWTIALGSRAILLGDFTRAFAYSDLARALQKILALYPKCDEVPPTCAPTGATGGAVTGAGSAPPPGGSGCGNAAAPPVPAPPAPGARLKPAAFEDDQPGRVVVRIFVDGQTVPFSGATDAGGYFFIPFIPEGRDFTAIAYDTLSGQSRSFDGVGPPFGKSVTMFFDFFTDQPGNVSGIVRDAAAGPVPSVLVRAVRPGDGLLAIGQATTDVAGRYRMPKLPANLTVTALPVIQPATVYVLSSGNAGADQAIMDALRTGGHQPTLGVRFDDWDGTQADLSSFDVVVLLKNFNFNTDAMLDAGASAVEAYVAAGGGVVTGELVLYNMYIGHPSNSPLKAVLPVITGGQIGQTTETTYTRENADPIIDRDLPASFPFSLIRQFTNVTETRLALKTGAVSFYHSSQVGGPGLAGWGYGQGRAVSLSTMMTGIELASFDYQQLVINAVSWAARRGE